jgi:hypothetical protein
MWMQDKQGGKRSMSDQLDVEDNGSSSQPPQAGNRRRSQRLCGKGRGLQGYNNLSRDGKDRRLT